MFGNGNYEGLAPLAMPGCITGVFWAVPVRPDLLGARLEAYAATQDIMRTVRLCNRYSNTASGITRMPAEVLNIIEEHVQGPLREQHEQEWSRVYKCVTGACDAEDHFSTEELLELELSLEAELSCDCGCGDIDCHIVQEALFDSDELYQSHHERTQEWQARVDQTPGAVGRSDDGEFVRLDKVRSNYGMIVSTPGLARNLSFIAQARLLMGSTRSSNRLSAWKHS